MPDKPSEDWLKFNFELYVPLIKFERELRQIIKLVLGKGWEKRIKNDLPDIYSSWNKKLEKEKAWGISTDEDILNYADLDDYSKIIKKYSKAFIKGNNDDNEAINTKLNDWYIFGRNPVMHGRMVTEKKFHVTNAAMDFIGAWMTRIKNSMDKSSLEPEPVPEPIIETTDDAADYSIDDHLDGKPIDIVNLANHFRIGVNAISPEVLEYPKQQYIGYTHRNFRNERLKPYFTALIVRVSDIRIIFRFPPATLTEVDLEHLLKATPKSWAAGNKSYYDLSDENQMDYFVRLAEACYRRFNEDHIQD